MELSDFAIGETFWTHGGAFRCTDVGTRVVVAVKLGPREIGRAEKVGGELRITKRIDDDASWLKHSLAYRRDDRTVDLEYKPVKMGPYIPMERKY